MKAAARYLEAFELHARPGYLFNAARSEMRCFNHGKAAEHFRQYMTLKDASPAGKKRARIHLEEIAAYNSHISSNSGTVQRTLWIAGASLMVVGGGLHGAAWAWRKLSNEQVIDSVAAIDHYQATVKTQSNLSTVGLVTASIGAVVTVVAGVRHFSKSDSKSPLTLGPWLSQGPGLALRGEF